MSFENIIKIDKDSFRNTFNEIKELHEKAAEQSLTTDFCDFFDFVLEEMSESDSFDICKEQIESQLKEKKFYSYFDFKSGDLKEMKSIFEDWEDIEKIEGEDNEAINIDIFHSYCIEYTVKVLAEEVFEEEELDLLFSDV